MRGSLHRIALAMLALAGFGCSQPVAPEGFTIDVRFISIDLDVVDEVRLRFNPPDGERFEARDPMTFEDGAISVEVDADGTLRMSITGDYVRAHAVPAPDGSQRIMPLQIWSDDPTMNAAPLVFGTAWRSGEAIGEGTVFLPRWPPPLGERTGLPIQCRADAAAMGLCTP
ncbi:MAG TPA: hypothetical protein VIL20_31240 [Sandaracinaceae bacterium]